MKEMMSRMKSFITFELPLQAGYISVQFTGIHTVQQKEVPQWSTASTRQKMIADYWFSSVIKHFALVFGLAVLSTLLFTSEPGVSPLFAILLAGSISFPVLYLFHYYPSFTSIFLPQLETIKEAYEQKQKEGLEKCRQAQLSNFALVLIYYVFTQAGNMNAPTCNDHSATLLMKLYGVDAGSLKKNLELILVGSKRKNLTDRKKTELKNHFSEAYFFLEDIDFTSGVQKLKELEMKFI